MVHAIPTKKTESATEGGRGGEGGEGGESGAAEGGGGGGEKEEGGGVGGGEVEETDIGELLSQVRVQFTLRCESNSQGAPLSLSLSTANSHIRHCWIQDLSPPLPTHNTPHTYISIGETIIIIGFSTLFIQKMFNTKNFGK